VIEERIARIYAAFNAREVDRLLAQMSPDVDWPNAWEGGRVRGRAAVQDYWSRQFQEIDPHVEPTRTTQREDGRTEVAVHQTVRRPGTQELLAEDDVLHVYTFDAEGLVSRMDVE
jgi:hypothetical protein